MKKLSAVEYGAVEWVLSYVSEMSLDERYREGIRELRAVPLTRSLDLTARQRGSLIAAIEYFEALYTRMAKGYPKGNRTVRDILKRTEYLKCAVEKIKGEANV